MQKHAATASVLLRDTNTQAEKKLAVGTDGVLVKELKVWSAQLVSILVSTGQRPQALFINVFFYESVMMEVEIFICERRAEAARAWRLEKPPWFPPLRLPTERNLFSQPCRSENEKTQMEKWYIFPPSLPLLSLYIY